MAETDEATIAESVETRVVEDAPPVASAGPSMAPEPDAVEAGGASTPTPIEDAAEPAPEPDPTPDPRIAELAAERDSLAARLAELEAVARERDAASQAAQEAAVERDALMADWGREKVQAGVLEALASLRFVSDDAGADFISTVLPKIQAERRKDGSWVAKGPAGLTVADAVKAEAERRPWLFRPSTRGGSGTDGSRPPADGSRHHPGSFEAIQARYQSRR